MCLEKLLPLSLTVSLTLDSHDLSKLMIFRGEGGIRTPGPVTVNGFQDRRIRPLCHLSAANVQLEIIWSKINVNIFK